MADAAVSFAIETVGNFLIHEGNFLHGVKGQVEEMQKELKRMQCFLKDAEARKGDNHSVRNWVSEIREATYDVDDLIERFVLKSALRNQTGVVNRIKKYAFSLNHAVELHRVGSGIEAIKVQLSNLRSSLQTYGIRADGEGTASSVTSNRRKRQDYPHIVDHNVVGLDGKIDELVQRLLDFEEGGDGRAAQPVVCLYGMGGVGKTTAAKKVYADHRIKAHFECFAWVYISQQFNPKQVWESILTQLSDTKTDDGGRMSDDELTSRLCRLQTEKKCLLVIDDIWRNGDWHELCAAFPYLEKDNRSKILLTTRNEGVVASHGVYHTRLDILDQSNSLELLKTTILFLGGPNHPIKENSNMDMLTGEMVKECKGLPLAIIVLGGVLATKHTLEDWKRVGANIKSLLKRGEQKGTNGVTSVLESSYEDLPYNLKPCFLHFSQYPEDEEMKAAEMIQIWVAEGFVPPSAEEDSVGDETMEEVAEEYLNELINRCMVQAGSRGHTGRVKTCRMHDLMRDLSTSKAREEGFSHSVRLGVTNNGTFPGEHKIRRISIYGHDDDDPLRSLLVQISPRLRSLSWFGSNDRSFELMVNNLKLVRIIVEHRPSLIGARYKQIRNLIHLRFLKLGLPKLETSISNLRFLQTLKLDPIISCEVFLTGGIRIPNSLWRMEQLRHLYLPEYSKCERKKQRVGNFRNLQTLVNFPPAGFDLQQNLVRFTNVRKLVIVRRLVEIGEVLRSQAVVFNRLQSLSFTSQPEESEESEESEEFELECVDLEAMTRACPRLYRLVVNASCTPIWPSDLTKLVLKHSELDESQMGTLARLRSLKVLFLHYHSFHGKEMVFHGNDFPQLRHLSLKGLNYLKAWTVHEGGLPSLSCLEIDDCWKLKSVTDGLHYLKQLKEIRVENMRGGFTLRLKQYQHQRDGVSPSPSLSFSSRLSITFAKKLLRAHARSSAYESDSNESDDSSD